MTEDEAKTKWCPMVRFHGTPSDDCIPNRSDSMTDATRCLGSACMAWRWQYQESGAAAAAAIDPGGFCGLAGKP